jgi:hypothetical protein
MPRRTKLDFEPLSLEETAKQLGIPRRRAQQILALFGADALPGPRRSRTLKRRSFRSKSPRTRLTSTAH